MPPKISRRASRTWDKLRQWYGARIAEQYGDVPPPDWCALVDHTEDERLDEALLAVRRESPIHPPTLGQLESAIPKRESTAGLPSKPQRLADLMLELHGKDLCPHQLARPWNYFGPMTTFELLPKRIPPAYVTHPDPRGVQVPACAACERPTFRVTLDQAVSKGVAA